MSYSDAQTGKEYAAGYPLREVRAGRSAGRRARPQGAPPSASPATRSRSSSTTAGSTPSTIAARTWASPCTGAPCKDGILTCHWHHARFDLASGGTFDQFADDVRVFPVEVRDGEVWVDLVAAGGPTGLPAPAPARRAGAQHLAGHGQVGHRAAGQRRRPRRAFPHRARLRRHATGEPGGARA